MERPPPSLQIQGKGVTRAKAIYAGHAPPEVKPLHRILQPVSVPHAAIDPHRQSRTVSTVPDLPESPHHPDTVYNDEMALFFLNHMAKPFPDNAILEKYEKPPITRDQVKSAIAPMKKEHEAQREALCDLQVEQMARLAKDQLLQVDAAISWTEQERISLLSWYKKQSEQLTHRQNETWRYLRESQQMSLLPLYSKVDALSKIPVVEGPSLPTTSEEFEKMDHASRYKVAYWLQHNRPANMRESSWTPEAQRALWELYSTNYVFKAKVAVFLASKRPQDPRRRNT